MNRRALVMIAALVLAGGACGGDDDGDVADDDVAEDAADATAGSGDSIEVSDDSGSGDSIDDPDDSDDSGSGDDPAGGEWCDLMLEIETTTLFDDLTGDDLDAIDDAYDEMLGLMDNAADSAPDEIKDDLEFLVEESRDLVDALRDVDYDFEAVDQSILEDPESIAAGERVDEYSERVCGIESGTGDTVG